MIFGRWKKIKYRGGLVTFRVPRAWVEELEPDGGGTFYEDTPESPALRLNVITAQSPSPVDASTVVDLLRSRSQWREVPVRSLPGGNACVAYTETAEEQGIPLLIHYWEVANAVPPNHIRIAVFSFTTEANRAEPAPELSWLDREICDARFAPELGLDTN
jgi:hypothetical protein